MLCLAMPYAEGKSEVLGCWVKRKRGKLPKQQSLSPGLLYTHKGASMCVFSAPAILAAVTSLTGGICSDGIHYSKGWEQIPGKLEYAIFTYKQPTRPHGLCKGFLLKTKILLGTCGISCKAARSEMVHLVNDK